MSKRENRKSPVAVFCSALGTVLLIIIVLGCLPLTLPRVFGFQIYTVISGSMEPEIPTGSMVYVKGVQPKDVKEDEVIAFYGGADSASIITHRVVANSEIMGEFITKGDANEEKDMNPIPYADYIGKVVFSVPVLGGIAQTFTSTAGKIAAASVVGLAVLLELVAALIERRRK